MQTPFNFNAFVSQNNQFKQIPSDMLEYNDEYERYSGEQYRDMVESIKRNGIMQPLIVLANPETDKYTILAGNNRKYCGEAAGLTMFPCIVKENLSSEVAQAYIDETNVYQRGFGNLKITKQAEVVARRYSEMFDEAKLAEIRKEIAMLDGKDEEETEENATEEKTTKMEQVGDEYGLSKNSIARLIRVNSVIPELKPLIDNGEVALRAAVEVSYLTEADQKEVYKLLPEYGIDIKRASLLHAICKERKLKKEDIHAVLDGTYKEKKAAYRTRSVKVKSTVIRKYFAKDCDEETILDTIDVALNYYFAAQEKEENDKKGNV